MQIGGVNSSVIKGYDSSTTSKLNNPTSNDKKKNKNNVIDTLTQKTKQNISITLKIQNIVKLNLQNAITTVLKEELNHIKKDLIKTSSNYYSMDELDLSDHKLMTINSTLKKINTTSFEINAKIDKEAAFETIEDIIKPKYINQKHINDYIFNENIFIDTASSNSIQKELLWLFR
jgi:hypothetical protein